MIQVFTNGAIELQQNGAILFTGSKNQKGCTATLNNGKIRLRSPGIYSVIANFSFTSESAGDVTVTMEKEGENVSTDSATGTAAAGGTVNLNIPSLIRVNECSCGGVGIGYTVSAAGTLIAANAVVTKVV